MNMFLFIIDPSVKRIPLLVVSCQFAFEVFICCYLFDSLEQEVRSHSMIKFQLIKTPSNSRTTTSNTTCTQSTGWPEGTTTCSADGSDRYAKMHCFCSCKPTRASKSGLAACSTWIWCPSRRWLTWCTRCWPFCCGRARWSSNGGKWPHQTIVVVRLKFNWAKKAHQVDVMYVWINQWIQLECTNRNIKCAGKMHIELFCIIREMKLILIYW